MSDAFDPYYSWLSIPPGARPVDHYRLLGVERFEDNLDVIANAADRRIGYVRTFQSGGRAALTQSILNELACARLCLLDPQRKRAYDDELRAGMSESPAMPPQLPAPSPAPRPSAAGATPAVNRTPLPAVPAAPGTSPAARAPLQPASIVPARPRPPGRALPRARWWHQPAVWIVGGGAGVAGVVVMVAGIALVRSREGPVPSAPEERPPVRHEVPGASGGGTGGEVAVSPERTPRSELPPPVENGQWALRFDGPHRVELGDSIGVPDMNADFTIELWLRMPAPLPARQYIASSEHAATAPPRRPPGSGWALRARPQGSDYLLEFHMASREAGPQTIVTPPLGTDGRWHHVAITAESKLVRLFVDGDVLRAVRYRLSFVNGESPIVLGAPPPSPSAPELREFVGDIRGFSISSICRYRAAFRPGAELPRDDHAEIALDFERSSGGTIVNRGTRSGLASLHGPVWIQVDFPGASD